MVICLYVVGLVVLFCLVSEKVELKRNGEEICKHRVQPGKSSCRSTKKEIDKEEEQQVFT